MIERDEKDGIRTLRLTHGKANAMDVELLDALLRELRQAAADDGCRALVVTARGAIFSAGVDLPRLLGSGADYTRRFLPLLSDFVEALFGFPRPLVVAANGHAIAGGAIVVLSADIRLMAAGTGRIGVPELLVGVPFPAAPFEVVRFAVPNDRLQELVYGGKTLLPEEARQQGLVDEVVEPEHLEARAHGAAAALAAIPREVFTVTKRALRRDALERMTRRRSESDAESAALWSSPETHQRIRDYLARTLRR